MRIGRTPAVALLLFSILLLFFPLFNVLGYEFSTAIALFIPWVIGPMVIRALRGSTADPAEFTAVLRTLKARIGVLTAIPAIVAGVNAFFVKNCSPGEGLLFYLLIPAVTAIWTFGLAALCSVAFRRRPFAGYALVLVLVLLYTLYLGYFTPQISSYNFIYGFFPGISYDEALTVTPTLVLFRGITLVCAALFFLLSRALVRNAAAGSARIPVPRALTRPTALNAGVLITLTAVVMSWAFRTWLGFESSSAQIQESLGSSYRTAHMIIWYSHRSFSDEEIRRVGAMHDFRFEQVEHALGVSFPRVVTSYIYPDDDTKGRFIGTKTTNIAKPWRYEVHLTKDTWEGTLKHELVHVLAGEFGMPVIRAHYNIGLVEGLATAVEGGFGNRTPDEYSAAVINAFGLVKDPARLIRPAGFATNASTVSYILMGSFCKHLIDRYGIVRFKQLYGGGDPASVFGKSYDVLIGEWVEYLRRIDVPESWRKHVMFYFNRPSIFAKECPRLIASLNDEAYRTLSRRNSVMAMKLFANALDASWNSDSYAGLVRSAYGAARYDTVVALVDRQLSDSLGRFRILNLFLLYGDALWARDDVLSARRAYGEVLSLDLSDRLDEAAALRMAALDETPLRESLAAYFTESISDSAALDLFGRLEGRTGSLIPAYLAARVLLAMHDTRSAVDTLDRMTKPFGVAVLDAGRERMLGEALFRLGKYEEARMHFWQSMNFITNRASLERVQDWLDRCEWFEEHSNR